MEPVSFIPIGVIHTPFTEREGMPIQPIGGKDARGYIEVNPELQEGMLDLDGFSHIVLIYQFHQSVDFDLRVKPFLDHELRGVFATRAPKRPNPIGISVVRLERIEGNKLYIRNIDILDGTPLLDIKPYVPEFDSDEEIRIGWLAKYIDHADSKRSDYRFK